MMSLFVYFLTHPPDPWIYSLSFMKLEYFPSWEVIQHHLELNNWAPSSAIAALFYTPCGVNAIYLPFRPARQVFNHTRRCAAIVILINKLFFTINMQLSVVLVKKIKNLIPIYVFCFLVKCLQV